MRVSDFLELVHHLWQGFMTTPVVYVVIAVVAFGGWVAIHDALRKRRLRQATEKREHQDLDRRRQRFAELRPVLEEIAASEPEYISVQIQESGAIIDIGQRQDPRLKAEVRVRIEPNWEATATGPREALGFLISESHEWGSREHTLESEQEIQQYLDDLIAPRIAKYRHRASQLPSIGANGEDGQ